MCGVRNTTLHIKGVPQMEPPLFIMAYKDKISGIGIVIKSKERLPYGSNSRGKFIPAEKGRRSIFVPSFGALEKEEVDYIVEASQEQEDERIRKGRKSEKKEQLEQVVEAVRRAPKGERAKTAKEIMRI